MYFGVLKLDFSKCLQLSLSGQGVGSWPKFYPVPYPFVHSVYSSPSMLFWEDKIIQSAEGVQEGNPLYVGPLLFCFTIHLLCEMCLFYLDDGTLGGRAEDVLQDLHLVKREGAELGLHLNRTRIMLPEDACYVPYPMPL